MSHDESATVWDMSTLPTNMTGERVVVKKAAWRVNGAGRRPVERRPRPRGYAVQRPHSGCIPESFGRSAQPAVRLEASRALRAVSRLLSNDGAAVLCLK